MGCQSTEQPTPPRDQGGQSASGNRKGVEGAEDSGGRTDSGPPDVPFFDLSSSGRKEENHQEHQRCSRREQNDALHTGRSVPLNGGHPEYKANAHHCRGSKYQWRVSRNLTPLHGPLFSSGYHLCPWVSCRNCPCRILTCVSFAVPVYSLPDGMASEVQTTQVASLGIGQAHILVQEAPVPLSKAPRPCGRATPRTSQHDKPPANVRGQAAKENDLVSRQHEPGRCQDHWQFQKRRNRRQPVGTHGHPSAPACLCPS